MIYAGVLKQNSTKLDSVPPEAKETAVLETVQGGGIKGFSLLWSLFIASPILRGRNESVNSFHF